MARLRAHLEKTFTLLACLIISCLPSGALAINLCDCNGILIETHAATCPCEAIPVEDPCCGGCDASGEHATNPGDAAEPADGEKADDSCCHELSLDYMVVPGDGPSSPPYTDEDPQPGPFDFDCHRVARHDLVPSVTLHATGPPLAPPRRRALLEHASIVLLI